jgi:tryptophan synthase alpha chain
MTGKRVCIYLMAGPDTPALAEAAALSGADMLEIGFPFSDPLADGPVVRRAAERALALGMRTAACLRCLAEVRARVSVPLIPMTYASILEAYGYGRFVEDAGRAGATSLIVADLPTDARPDVRRVQLVAPTTPPERIRMAAEWTDGWLYLVSVTGPTGARSVLSGQLPALAERARMETDLPLLAGFGISTPHQAAAAASLTDGIVVGSMAIHIAAQSGPAGLRRFVSSLRRAVDDVAVHAMGER